MPILGPEEFRLALQIFFTCPPAMAITLIMVTAANGHRGLSILVAVLSTIISVFTIPLMLVWLIPSLQRIHINVGQVLLDTILMTLLPLIVGRGLRCISPVKKVLKRWDTTVKYTAISFLIGIILVKVSEVSFSGNLKRVSILNIICVVSIGTTLATFNLLASYGLFSFLPWFSKKSKVTLPILNSIHVVVMTATIIDVLPDKAGDKSLLTLPGVFVYLVTLLVLNCFVAFAKVNEDDENDKENTAPDVEKGESEDPKDSNVDSKINEIAVFTIYTDEMTVRTT